MERCFGSPSPSSFGRPPLLPPRSSFFLPFFFLGVFYCQARRGRRGGGVGEDGEDDDVEEMEMKQKMGIRGLLLLLPPLWAVLLRDVAAVTGKAAPAPESCRAEAEKERKRLCVSASAGREGRRELLAD